MYKIFLGAAILLVVTCLIVRDRTEDRLSRLRAELMALRSEEKRQGELRDEVEIMVAQAGEALMRADRRLGSLEKGCREMADLLETLNTLVFDEKASASESAEAEEQL